MSDFLVAVLTINATLFLCLMAVLVHRANQRDADRRFERQMHDSGEKQREEWLTGVVLPFLQQGLSAAVAMMRERERPERGKPERPSSAP